MIKTTLFTFAVLLVMLSISAQAQTDTSGYDLGRVSVKKNFTQNITIKGSDLERFQFSDLADAINVWLYGTYTNSSTLTYVIDGNIITDVNAYSIYDVDEVTLVQNAIAQVSGAATGQQMVVIKLKTLRPGKQGVEAAAQTSLVDVAKLGSTTTDGKRTNNIYDQFYVGAYKNTDIAGFGLSADYQHDISPIVLPGGGFSNIDPRHFERIKLNGYANAKLWTGTDASFGINYTPQPGGANINYQFAPTANESLTEALADKNIQHMASLNLTVNSIIAKGFTNKLSGAYNRYNFFESYATTTNQIAPDNSAAINLLANASEASRDLLIRDNLAYHTKLGMFDVEPALNFSFRSFKDIADEFVFELEEENNAVPAGQSAEQSTGYKVNLSLLTPTVNIYYKKAVDLQAGFVYILNHYSAAQEDGEHLYHLAPFVSATADVSDLWDDNKIALKVFGSFSQQNSFMQDPSATFFGFATPAESIYTVNSLYALSTATGMPVVAGTSVNPFEQFNSFQAGFTLGLSKDFFIDYSFSDNYTEDLAIVIVPVGANESAYSERYYFAKLAMNRLGIRYNLNSNNFSWRTGFNIAQEQLSFAGQPPFGPGAFSDYLDEGHRYSGGFTNRFTYKTFFAGLDFLYQFGQRPITLANVVESDVIESPPHVNSVSLQNLYFGAKIKVNRLKYAEIFANTRNILQNNSSDITDNRRFYGLGLKVGL